MSSSLFAKFDPKAKHSFTDHTKGVIPEPPRPSMYAQGVHSAHATVAYMQNPPTHPPPTPLVAPIPQYAPPPMDTSRSTSSASSTSSSSSASYYNPIFTQVSLAGRAATPELEDILKKKKKATWNK